MSEKAKGGEGELGGAIKGGGFKGGQDGGSREIRGEGSGEAAEEFD